MVQAAAEMRPKWLSEQEFYEVMMPGKDREDEKKMMSFRLTGEARRIIEEAGLDIGDKTKALEIIVRFYREHEVKRKK